jgi:type IV fimbrial biogenesis protein FimT
MHAVLERNRTTRPLAEGARRCRGRQRGVTLIELMIALTIAAVLLGVAVPNFRNFIAANRLSSAAQDFLASLQLARSEAIRSGGQVSLRLNGTPGSGDWGGAGWTMFIDSDADGALDVGEQVVRDGTPLAAPLTLKGSTNFNTFIAFDRDGRLTSGGGVFVLCQGTALTEDGQPRARAVVVNGAGRVRMAQRNSSGIPVTDTAAITRCSP